MLADCTQRRTDIDPFVFHEVIVLYSEEGIDDDLRYFLVNACDRLSIDFRAQLSHQFRFACAVIPEVDVAGLAVLVESCDDLLARAEGVVFDEGGNIAVEHPEDGDSA